MAALARSGSREENLVEVLADACFGHEDILAAWDGRVRSLFVYRPEWNEVVRTVPHMLSCLSASGCVEGDCDCISVLFGAGAVALGYPVRFVAIRTEEDCPDYLHVYTEVMDGGWRRFDATVPLAIVDDEMDFGRLEQGV